MFNLVLMFAKFQPVLVKLLNSREVSTTNLKLGKLSKKTKESNFCLN